MQIYLTLHFNIYWVPASLFIILEYWNWINVSSASYFKSFFLLDKKKYTDIRKSNKSFLIIKFWQSDQMEAIIYI